MIRPADTTTPCASAPHPKLVVDLGAVARNYARLCDLARPARVSAVVKADAYGLGVDRVAAALAAAGCGDFFVATADEGTALRAILGAGARIYVFNGYWDAELDTLRGANLIPVVNDAGQLDAVRALDPRPAFALHIDTGINRLGLTVAEARAAAAGDMDGLVLLVSHLACADEAAHPLNERQRAAFAEAGRLFPGIPASLANSAGVLLGKGHHFDLCRPGIALYGGAPTPGETSPFEPAARIEAPILQVRELAPGDAVGYGATFTAGENRRAAIVALGYADGLFRTAQQGGYGRIGEHILPIMGLVSMDLVTLDVTGVPDLARPGAYVTFMGRDLEALAAASGTLSYELLVRLGSRFTRVYESAPARR